MEIPNIIINPEPALNTNRVTYRRNGTTYVIKNDGSDEDVADIHAIINEMYDYTMILANNADLKASFCKASHIFGAIFVTIAGSVIGALSACTNNILVNYNATINIDQNITVLYTILYTTTVLGFCISVVKTLLSIFNIEQRGLILKDIAIKLRKIARNIKGLKNVNISIEEIYRRIDDFHTEIDELNVSMFGSTQLPKNKIKTQLTDVHVTV